jgi:hypothetical protein
MNNAVRSLFVVAVLAASAVVPAFAGAEGGPSSPAEPQRNQIYQIVTELEQQAMALAEESFNHFRDWNGAISDQEQAILFKSEAFAASCRLFLKLAETRSDYFRSDYARTNLFSSFTFLANSFNELEQEMKRGGVMPYALSSCRRIMSRLEQGFRSWPDADNLAYLDQKYVKAEDATVYLIVKKSLGTYAKRPFKNLESLFRYNYDRNRGKNPWDHLVETSEDTLDKMRTEAMIDLTFEGKMVIEQSNRRNRAVFLIENGKKRPLANPDVVARLGGRGRVFEVPREVLDSYEDGDPIDR